ncbi:hypothetical protein TWF730_000579 [Orbilia blumenaviensis]|uniref:Uncharacterized protein n=1 Tax=Orbilia blumenaviensis TaxID=1796055 RepID=A0AAV9VPP6_9PEZI
MTRITLPHDRRIEEPSSPSESTPPYTDASSHARPKTPVETPLLPQVPEPKVDSVNIAKSNVEVREQPKVFTINRNDPPQPGSVYIINESSTSQVITNDGGRITLTNFDGDLKKSQMWTCVRSDGWLGFTNNPGHETKYLGHDFLGSLVCTAALHLAWEHFNVMKREGDGFEIMVRHWFGSLPLGFRGDGRLGKGAVRQTWWGFTKVI